MSAASNEPVAVGGLISTAVTSTIGILLYLDVDPELVAAITLAASGWIAAIAAIVRGAVTPTAEVALTHADVAHIESTNNLPPPAPPKEG